MSLLFWRGRHRIGTDATDARASNRPELLRPLPPRELLATPRRQRLLEHIWQRTSLSRRQFSALYLAPIERYAVLVQQFPASESHHHAYPGGMLDHGLEIVAYALKLRQSHLLPAGAPPEAQAAQSEAWSAAVAYAALLHDIGKVAVDLDVQDAEGTPWHPWHGPLRAPYRFRYRQDRQYRLHSAATSLLYTRILDQTSLDWLVQFREAWSALLFVLAGQYEHAGILGELVRQADQASVAQALGGDPAKALAAPKHSLQRKLLEGLRFLLREQLKLNQPQASDGWLTDEALWLVSKTVSDKLRAHLLSQGMDGIPASNSAVFDVLQDHGIAQPTPEGKAIWQATIASSTGWTHDFTLLKVAPALIWDADDRPAPFAGTVTVATAQAHAEPPTAPGNDGPATSSVPAGEAAPGPQGGASAVPDALAGLLDILPPVDSAQPPATGIPAPLAATDHDQQPRPGIDTTGACTSHSAEVAGTPDHFMQWLASGLTARKLIMNDTKALVHTVANTLYLVSPGIFQRYAMEHPHISADAKAHQMPDWQWVQKQFERAHLHRKHRDGLNIWTCVVTGPRRKSKRLHGYLLEQSHTILDFVPANNPYLQLDDDGDTASSSPVPKQLETTNVQQVNLAERL